MKILQYLRPIVTKLAVQLPSADTTRLYNRTVFELLLTPDLSDRSEKRRVMVILHTIVGICSDTLLNSNLNIYSY
jgi:hypothetical protein